MKKERKKATFLSFYLFIFAPPLKTRLYVFAGETQKTNGSCLKEERKKIWESLQGDFGIQTVHV